MIGKTISHYNIIEKIGEGGMGIVYKAQDIKLDRFVALKFLPSHLTKNETDLARFVQEAKAAAALNHSNVCTIYEIQDEGENPFIVMECVEGETLREKIKEPRLKMKDVVDYAIQISEALIIAHKKGIIHRDIKSENIMVTKTDQVKVMDFGLAKLKGSVKLTKSSSTVGTMAYMSPEHLQGKEVDARTDIFSFGVVLYEMLTGQLPFKGEYESAMMYSILNDEPEPIQKHRSDLSSELLHVLNRALEKNPKERYQNINDMLIDLKRLKRDTERVSVDEQPDMLKEPVKPGQKIIKKILLPVGTIVILVITYFIIKSFLLDPDSRPKSIAVIPFENFTGDPSFNDWRRALSKMLTTSLSGSPDLFVLNHDAIDAVLEKSGTLQTVQVTPSIIDEIVNRNNIGIIIRGDILPKVDDRLLLQLMIQDVKSDKILKSTIVEGKSIDNFFEMVYNLADSIRNYLELKSLKEGTFPDRTKVLTKSAVAYRYYLLGRDSWDDKLFLKAIEIDSNFVMAKIYLTYIYHNRANYENPYENIRKMKKWASSVYKAKDKLPYYYQVWAEYLIAHIEKRPYDRIRWAKELVRLDPQIVDAWHNIGFAYERLGQYEKAIPYYEKAISRTRLWGKEFVYSILQLNRSYHMIGNHKKELEVLTEYLKSADADSSNIYIFKCLASANFCIGDTANTNLQLANFRQILEANKAYEAEILTHYGDIYMMADQLDQAESYFRRAMNIDSEHKYNVLTVYHGNEFLSGNAFIHLAYLLVTSEKNVDEGVELAENALQVDQNHSAYQTALYISGLGYLKQGKYTRAVDALQEVYNLNTRYFEWITDPLQTAKKALAKEKENR
jgi:serine/threonine protein kinase/tetratricopeptide (TPR) repeat protein